MSPSMHLSHFGFMSPLQRQLEALKPEVFDRVNRSGGLEVSDLLEAVGHPKSHDVYDQHPLDPDNIVEIGSPSSAMADVGRRLLAEGKVGVVSPAGSHDSHAWNFSYMGKVHTIHGYESLHLTPDNQLVMEGGDPSYHPCGSGDIIPSLIGLGELSLFLTAGGRHIFITSDRVRPDLIGHHAAAGLPVTCGIEQRRPDHQTIPCMHGGFNQLVHRCRFMNEISDDLLWGWNGAMVVDALLDFRNVEWKWHRRKRVSGVSLVIEYQRYIDDLTAAFRTQFVRSE